MIRIKRKSSFLGERDVNLAVKQPKVSELPVALKSVPTDLSFSSTPARAGPSLSAHEYFIIIRYVLERSGHTAA